MIDTKKKSVRSGDFLRKEDVHLSVNGVTQLEIMRELALSLGLDDEHCSARSRVSSVANPWNHCAGSRRGRTPLPELESHPASASPLAAPRRRYPGALRTVSQRAVRFPVLPRPTSLPKIRRSCAKIAHLVNNSDFRRRLDELHSADEFSQLLADAGV